MMYLKQERVCSGEIPGAKSILSKYRDINLSATGLGGIADMISSLVACKLCPNKSKGNSAEDWMSAS